MGSATVQISVVPKRLLKLSEAARYCGPERKGNENLAYQHKLSWQEWQGSNLRPPVLEARATCGHVTTEGDKKARQVAGNPCFIG